MQSAQQQLFRSLLSVIYQTHLSPEHWLVRVSTALSKLLHLDQGLGVFGYFCKIVPGNPAEDLEWGAERGIDVQPFVRGFRSYRTLIDPNVQLGMHSNLICGYSSEMMPAFFKKEKKLIKQVTPMAGADDSFGINALGPEWHGALFASFIHPDRISRPNERLPITTYALIREIAYHLAIAAQLVRRPKGMTIAEAFLDFQQRTMHSLVLSPVFQRFHDVGKYALEDLAFLADQQETKSSRLSLRSAQQIYERFQQGRFIVHHRFERSKHVYWIIQKPIPMLKPRIPFTNEEQCFFEAYAIHDSIKQAIDFLPKRRSLAYVYQLLQSIASKLSIPDAKPEELLPLAKVWIAGIKDQPGELKMPRTSSLGKPPPGLRVTVFSVGIEPYYVMRLGEESKMLPSFPGFPRSAMQLVTNFLAGQSLPSLATMHNLELSTVKRRLATARRLGLLNAGSDSLLIKNHPLRS